MGEENKSIAFLREYRAHPEKYLPLVDHQYKHFDKWDDQITRNMFWDAGIMEGDRPYFAECWKVFLTTSMTVFFSAEGYEDVKNDLTFMLELLRAGLVVPENDDFDHIRVMRFKDGIGHEFISFNCVLGIDEKGSYMSWLGGSCGFDELNRLNGETGNTAEENGG